MLRLYGSALRSGIGVISGCTVVLVLVLGGEGETVPDLDNFWADLEALMLPKIDFDGLPLFGDVLGEGTGGKDVMGERAGASYPSANS